MRSAEAEVNSSSGSSISDAASSWAGWAVSAVTSKFYKSQPSKTDEASPAGQVKNLHSPTLNAQTPSEVSDSMTDERSRKSSFTSESSKNGNATVTLLLMIHTERTFICLLTD